ncbi:CBF domain-containing protein [Citrus sinensis]|nr:CBF domain-containing protein [Citrus sinensis]
MSDSKPSKTKNKEDVELLKSDIASFASSLGLSSASAASSGFNDSDFRKTGPIKPQKKLSKSNEKGGAQQEPSNTQKPNIAKFNKKNQKPKPDKKFVKPQKHNDNDKTHFEQELREEMENSNSKPVPKAPVLTLESGANHDKYKKMPKLPLVKAGNLGVWYVDAKELEDKVLGGEEKSNSKRVVDLKYVERKRELGERLLWQYVSDYEGSRGQTGDIKMLAATQRSGTAADKVSAFSVIVGDNPMANLRSLDALLGMVSSKVGKRHALTGFEALKELFVSSLLPDRKLKTLVQRPLDNLPETKDGYSLLLFWYYEEFLKQRYERFVLALEESSRDVLPVLKTKALKIVYALLTSKPEQEHRLLSALVNKLGDPQNKGASNADFHLSNLLADHPNMKVNFLSQIRLSHKGDGPKVAKRLIDVYFALFKVLITEAGAGDKMDKNSKTGNKHISTFSKKSQLKISPEPHIELDSRILSALLMGVNRAFPYVSSNEADDIIEVQTPMLFKLAEMFIGLLHRAMKNDVNLKRVAAFSKRLLQVVLQQPPQYACGCLFLLSEVLKARPPLWNMVLQNESVDEDLEHFEDVVEETDNEPSDASKIEENDVKLVKRTDDAKSDSESSEDEDIPTSDSEEDVSDQPEELIIRDNPKDLQKSKAPSHHVPQPPTSSKSSLPGGYNPRHREPSYCNADHVSWWELMVLASHVHPSVSTMAGTLLSGANIVYNGNPLSDLTLTAFLDKFMEKKPKPTTWHGGSQIEPAKKLDMNHQLIGQEILSLAEVDVPPEDLVFHKFYMNKVNTTKKPKKKKKKKGAEDEAAEELFDVDGDDYEVEGGDESDNEEIDNMLDSTDLSLVGDGDYDYDDLDKVADEDDDDLVGDASDLEMGAPDDSAEREDFDTNYFSHSDDDDDNVQLNIGAEDDGSDEGSKLGRRKRKRKSHKKAGATPFASLEDYQHLLDDNDPSEMKSAGEKKLNLKKKRMPSM